MKILLPTVITLAAVAMPADWVLAQRDFRGLVYARTSGNTCKADNYLDAQRLFRGDKGTRNIGNGNDVGDAFVYCPIIRRNTAPYGKKESADPMRNGDNLNTTFFTPTAMIEQIDVALYFQPGNTQSNCTVYGRTPGPAPTGSEFFSSTKFTCSSNQPSCTGPWRSATLSWTRPFTQARPLVNVGYLCDLAQNATVVGSVASFSGNFVAVP